MSARPPLPRRPYRDSLLLNLGLAALILVIAWATGGDLGRAIVFAIGYFLIATAWAWWRFHRRIEEEAGR